MTSGGAAERFRSELRAGPELAVVAVDFDGTLSEIVSDPAAARPRPGVPALLDRLAGQLGTVAVVSGRPLSFLVEHLTVGDDVQLVGLYGLERRVDGCVVEHPDAGRWRAAVTAALADLRGRSSELGSDGIELEDKGASLTVHFRAVPDRAAVVRSVVGQTAASVGLVARDAKMSVELHPPVAVDKGTVLAEVAGAGGTGPVCFVGDDLGDLRALDALDALEVAGRRVLRVVVSGDETPAPLLERADLVVAGPSGAVGFLESLLA